MLRGFGFVDTSVKYLFIDGGYLDVLIQTYSKKFYPSGNADFDYSKLGLGFTKVFYYHSPPNDESTPEKHDAAKAERYDRLIESLQLPGWHVSHGRRKLGKYNRYTQKQVDVQIAVDLLSHSYKRNMHSATLLAGDEDFVPVVDAVVKEGMQLTVWDDLIQHSPHLRAAADDRKVFDPWQFNALRSQASRGGACRLPTLTYSSEPIPDGYQAFEKATSNFGKEFLLCHHAVNNAPLVICPQQRDVGGNYRCYLDNDIDFLKQFVDTLHEKLTWTSWPNE
ncbi:MAG: NYN domain-containing protein [Ramlibacter sp.]